MYKVIVQCDSYCESYESAHVVFETPDADKAIDYSDSMRDSEHFSWVIREGN